MTGRIRSIKPEFPQSETIGKLSRDARLLFIQLWTLVDDDGRARAASRMLASLLYPYDDDAAGLIDGWLSELELVGAIERYEVSGSTFVEITNWRKHQKIDHAKPSKLPSPREGSRVVATIREASRKLAPDLDQDLDQDRDQSNDLASLDHSSPMNGDANVIDLPKVKRSKPDDTELLQTVAGLWNETARSVGLSEIEALSDKRVATLRARIRSLGDFGLADDPLTAFRRWATNIRGSPFLHGSNGTWRADFDFAISPKGFVKIMEGSYASQQRNGALGRH